jgi:hypothetical protein
MRRLVMKALLVHDAQAGFCDVCSDHRHAIIAGSPSKVFGTVIARLEALSDWLLSHDANSAALKSTVVDLLRSTECSKPLALT